MRFKILLIFLSTVSCLKIGVLDTTGTHTAVVNNEIGAIQNIEIERVNGFDVDTVRAAKTGGVIAYIGGDQKRDAYALSKEMERETTPLISPAIRSQGTSFDLYNFVKTISASVEEFATRIVNYADQHNVSNIAVIHTDDAINNDLAVRITQSHDSISRTNRCMFYFMPKTEEQQSLLYQLIKKDLIELVIIASNSLDLTKSLVYDAMAKYQIHEGRVWMIAKLDSEQDLETEITVENVLILRQAASSLYREAALVMSSALEVFLASPPNPWSSENGTFLNTRITAAAQQRGRPGTQLRLYANNTWADTVTEVWPVSKSYNRTGVKPLEGVTLRMLFKITPPYLYEQSGAPAGYIAELERQLRILLGYTANIDLTFEPHNKAIEKIGNPYDIIIGDFSITKAREELYDFTLPFVETSDSMIMRFPTSTTNLFQFTEPFTRDVWFVWIGLWVLTGIMFFILGPETEELPETLNREDDVEERKVKYQQARERKMKRRIEKPEEKHDVEEEEAPDTNNPICFSMYQSFATMKDGFDGDTVSKSRMFFMVGLIFATLMFNTTYTAQLAALLATKDTAYAADSFREIRDGKKAISGVAVPLGSSNQVRFEDAMEIGNAATKEYIVSQSEEQMVQQILNDTAAIGIYDAIWVRWRATSSKDCKLIQHGPRWNRFGLGFGLRKESPFTSHFSNAILELRDHDEYINQLEDRFLIGPCEEIAPTGEDNNIEQVDIRGFIVIWSLVAFLFMLSVTYRKAEIVFIKREAYKRAFPLESKADSSSTSSTEEADDLDQPPV